MAHPLITTDPPTVLVTDEVAAHVLHSAFPHDPHALIPGGFHTKLIEAIWHADRANRERLRAGFPEYVAAVQLLWTGHVDVLRAAAHGTAS